MSLHTIRMFSCAALTIALALPAAAQNVPTDSCSTFDEPRSSWQVNVGNGNQAGDGNVSVGTNTGSDVSINERIVFGNHNGVVAVGGRSTYPAMEILDSSVQLVRGNTEAACTNPGARFYSIHQRAGGTRAHYNPQGNLAASIKACHTYRGAARCSRTVDLGALGTYTANRGYPPCGDNTQQTDPGGFVRVPRTPATGTFNIRIYGKVCEDRPGGASCVMFRKDGVDEHSGGLTCIRAHRFGYTATFAPGGNCGPPEWPTGQMRTAWNNGDTRYPPYARWCDFTVKANCPPNHDRDVYFAQYCEYRDRDTSSLDPPPGRVAEFHVAIVNAHGTPRQYASGLGGDMGRFGGGDTAWLVRTEGRRIDQAHVIGLREIAAR